MKHVSKIILFSTLILSQYAAQARIADVMIAIDNNENKDGAITRWVNSNLCNLASPIIMTRHILDNIIKNNEYNEKFSENIDTNFDIYRNKSNTSYLFVPKKYDKTTIIKEEFNISKLDQILMKEAIKSKHTEKLKTEDNTSDQIINFFADEQNQKSIFWNIVLAGHGGFSLDIQSNITPNTMLKKSDASKASLAGLPLNEFRKLIQFFIKTMQVNFLYYLTCYAGDINRILPYATTLINEKGNIIGSLKNPNFIVVSAALTSAVVYSTVPFESCKFKNQEDISAGDMNFGSFFQLLWKYSSKDKKSVFTDKQLTEILTAITPRSKVKSAEYSIDDPYGISALPSIMYPNTETFRVFPLDDKIGILSNVLLKTHLLENKPIVFDKKEALLIYPEDIPLEIRINSDKQISIVSMVPGMALHNIDKISTNMDFSDFKKSFYTGLVFNKYYFIKKLVLKADKEFKEFFKVKSETIELSNVIISQAKDIDILFVGPDQYIYLNDITIKEGILENNITDALFTLSNLKKLFIEDGLKLADLGTKASRKSIEFAISKGDKNLTSTLIEKKYINYEEDKKTPLDLAIEKGNKEIIDVLKKHGAQTSKEIDEEDASSNLRGNDYD